MTPDELIIFQKAMEKAMASGYKPVIDFPTILSNTVAKQFIICFYRHILFDPEFAKAMWGDTADEPCDNCLYKQIEDGIACDVCEPWAAHLQAMVMADSPIKYLESFV